MRQNVADPVKSTTPELLELGEKGLRPGDGADLGLDELLTAVPPQMDEAGLLQDRHGFWTKRADRIGGPTGDRERPAHRPADDVSPGSVRQRPEDEIGAPLLGCCTTYNHMVVILSGVALPNLPRRIKELEGNNEGDDRRPLSVDGVMQGLGRDQTRTAGRVRPRRMGHPRLPVPKKWADINEVYAGATAFLFGRQTYEIFARLVGSGTRNDG